MNLFFRLLSVFLRANFARPRVSLFDTTRLRSRVMLTDQDMFAHMTNSRYFSFSDLAVINYIVRTGTWPKLRKRGWFPVVCAESVTFSRMLSWRDRFEIETRLIGWTDTYMCLQHDFIRDGKPTAMVRIIARFASRKRDRVTMDDVVAYLGVERTSPALPAEFENMVADVESARQRHNGDSAAA
ncbi:thioesterase [Henriciella barbarensis]|uniref:Thioesterase n=1 Tax=Henriciella barbarensis TaxID=86342 RepID=A0A399QR16_9PROT|nr:thioesterase family protein [Henriciella barbarensis]RIJ20625.1 thioesterase [Henriciella barbarensis]